MKKLFQIISAFMLVFLMSNLSFGQLEKVIVERYYVSDATDATNTTGGVLEEGSVTYRIFLDLAPGTVLKGIYGNESHPFSISSTQPFYNNTEDGQSFAKDFIKSRYLQNTVALDTWLTLGQTAKKQANITYYGVPKASDNDGSFIGGVNNDGGSAAIAEGLLTNVEPTTGLALTIADGMDTLVATPTSWLSNGIVDFLSGNDSTIFGSITPGNSFYSTSFSLAHSGVQGVVADSNQVIVAQLTTKGDLAFKINVELEYLIDGVLTTVYYVGSDSAMAANEVYSPYLSFPYECGCNDANFLEYNSSFICYSEGSCITPLVLGCTDPMACNYDVAANVNVTELCCYPGWCNNRNIEEVCPSLMGNSFDFELFPNPASSSITVNVINGVSTDMNYMIYNAYGAVVKQHTVTGAPMNYSETIDVSGFTPGIYQFKVVTNQGEHHKLFVKL